jgi:hypothetical protein
MKTTSSMWEMLGFTDQNAGNPSSPKYYKNIIPKDYGVSEREGIYYYGETIPDRITGSYENSLTCPQKICVDRYSEQNWTGSNEYGNTYYYPVLPKFNEGGKFDSSIGLQGEKSPFGSKIEWDEDDIISPVSNLKYSNRKLEIDLDFASLGDGALDDASGNAFKGLIIGDYRMTFDGDTRKPLKDDTINEPSINSKDKAI